MPDSLPAWAVLILCALVGYLTGKGIDTWWKGK